MKERDNMAKSKRKFYRNVVSFVVLSEGEPVSGGISPATLAFELDNGGLQGENATVNSRKITPRQAVETLRKLGLDAFAFDLDDNGNDL